MSEPSTDRWSDAIGVGALAMLAGGARLRLLTEHAEVTGTDGYYYVVQVHDAVATGALHVPDASVVLWFLAAVHAVVPDPILAVKIGAAALAAAVAPAAWLAGRRLGGPAAGWICAAWAVASPTLTHMAADFPKNLGAIPAFLVVLALAGRGPVASGVAAAAALACALSHRTGAALLALLALGWLGSRAWAARPSARDALPWVGAGVLFVGATAVLPNLLHPGDLDRVTGQLRPTPWPPLPMVWAGMRHTSPAELAEWFLPWLALPVAAASAWLDVGRRPALLALAVPTAVCAWPWWSDDTLDLGYRLTLLGPVLAVALLAAAAPRDWDVARSTGARALFVAMLAAPLVAWQGWSAANDPPYARWRTLVAHVPRPLPPLVIAHPGLSFLYDHLTGEEALPWAPEPDLDRQTIGRIVWGVRDAEWAALGAKRVTRLDADYAYVDEATWERALAAAAVDADPDLRARLHDPRNPTRVRPASLRRNH